MSEHTILHERPVPTPADIFNSAVASWAIAAAWEIGAMEELADAGKLDVADFAARHRLDHRALMGVFAALAAVRVVERRGDTVLTGPGFVEVNGTRSLFHWLSRGSAELFRQMPSVLSLDNRTGEFYRRDGAAISYACREANELFFAPSFWETMENLDIDFSRVADLGSGSGDRLAQIAKRYPGTTGVGVDISAPSIELATAEIAKAGLADRISFVRGDVTALTPRPDFTGVDLLTCFMMGHDLWPRDNCVRVLRSLREAFPDARRLLLSDTARSTGFPDDDVPVFTLGFEVAHDLMGVYVPTVQEWRDVFADGGWELISTRLFHLPAEGFVFELG